MEIFVILVLLGFTWKIDGAPQSSYSGLSVNGTKCGQKRCQLNEYCSEFDTTCQPCSVVCDLFSKNKEEVLCERQCQDYLHDLRYVRRASGEDELRVTVSKLSRMLTITLTLVIFMLVVLAGLLCFQLYRWKVKKNITLATLKKNLFKKSEPARDSTGNTNGDDKKMKDLRLEMPSRTINSDHSPVTVSTSIDRRPAEDSTLDYAYDNPVMAHKSPNRSY
ncbi:hypothetical protein ABEB36_008103 [Hypothenemus hampei]|uniref:Protein grindelwald n=1 Tax=Hypothenemus hampei TaxID=57062 RepID=A0ABD1EKX5_HYPHA